MVSPSSDRACNAVLWATRVVPSILSPAVYTNDPKQTVQRTGLSWRMKDQLDVTILFHFLCAQHVSDINISISGACDCVVELPHRSSCSQFVVCWKSVVAGFGWCTFCRLVIQQHSRRLLKMDILMSETCWVQKKWNKIVSDIKLVFHSSSITMMHGPINVRFTTGLSVRFDPLTAVTMKVNLLWDFNHNVLEMYQVSKKPAPKTPG